MSRSQLDRGGGSPALGLDDSGCTVLHVDMDAFFASCELRSRPQLVGRPVIVGVPASRSVVLAATYEARAFGVHSAMPMSRARQLCPQAVVIEPTFELYQQVSAGVMAVFADVTPLVEPLSLDEAFLDVSGALRRLGGPAQIGQYVRARVRTEQGITCSVGVASTKHVAKLASARCKPDGLLVVPAGQVLEFLHPLPVSALWGVGDKTDQVLARLGLRTVSELAHAPLPALRGALGRAVGEHLHELAWGRDARPVRPNEPDKSIGAEETFAADVEDPVVVRAELLRLSERVAVRVRAQQVVGRTVALKVRFADFTTITRSRTLAHPTDVAQELYATANNLYSALRLDRVRVRLVGIRLEGLSGAGSAPEQLTLDGGDAGRRQVEQVADAAAARFGHGAVVPARLVAGASDPRVTSRRLAVPRPRTGDSEDVDSGREPPVGSPE